MATRLKRLQGVVLGIAIAIAFGAAAATFPYFAPVTGLLKGNANDYHTTLAAGTDVAAVFTGTCNSGTFLKGDGSCGGAGSGGTVTSVQAAGTGIFAFTGGPVTGAGTLTLTQTGTSGGIPYFSAAGTLSSSAALTANTLVLGGGAGATPASLGAGTSTTILHGGSPPTYAAVSLTADVTGLLPFANMADGAALSVFGRSANTSGVMAAMAAATDGNVMRRSGTAVGFGSLDLAAAGTVGSTILPVANGGLNLAAAADDNVPVGNGTTWQTKALTSCSAATSAVTYNTTTNAWGCNTISGGVAQTTGSFTVTWDDGCTTSPTSAVSWTLTGTVVTMVFGPMTPTTCTSDSANMRATSTATVPMALRPTASQYVVGVYTTDNGVHFTGAIGIGSNGIVDAVNNCAAGCPGPSWVATGTKSVGFDRTTSIVYQLN